MTPSSAEMQRDDSKVTLATSGFQFTRIGDDGVQTFDTLSRLMHEEKITSQCWVFVGPHDDDICLGAGLFIQAAVKAGIDARFLVVTDGGMGYCSQEEQETIVEIRQKETLESFKILGVESSHVDYMNYPDNGLSKYQGRRVADLSDDRMTIKGYVGLQNSFTYFLRQYRPTRVFVPTPTDLHPDHQMTHNELMISLFHASGNIWPELGQPLFETPSVFETAVYCDFCAAPNLEVMAAEEIFNNKLESLRAFQSQTQIEKLVRRTEEQGPVEYLREVNFPFYAPRKYTDMFTQRRAEINTR